jgi:GMP synthase (glutamine-hydrolysing)
MDSIAILDFGSQYAQLIARRVRAFSVYSELFTWDAPVDEVLSINPVGFILSGGPASVYEELAPQIPRFVLESCRPVLGICYGMQALVHSLGGQVAASDDREYGSARLETIIPNPLLALGQQLVWMSHGDRVERLPESFTILSRTQNSPIAAIGDLQRSYFGLQFHPEVHHTQGGSEILQKFVFDVCGAQASWTPASIIDEAVEQIRARVGREKVLVAVSGGVDSSVAAALVNRAVGEQLVAVFIDTGLLRHGEPDQVREVFQKNLGMELLTIEANDQFMRVLEGVTDPEDKRRRIGETFIRIFEACAEDLGSPPFLVQGTIYPDVVESRAPERSKVERIKTHHNVGGLPDDMRLGLVEPLRYLFKDEVRLVGEVLGLPKALVWRQPFPGPGLAVRCLGEVTPQRLSRLRAADAILLAELDAAGFLGFTTPGEDGHVTAQAFAVLLPVRSVGVMGDQRTYQEVIALRVVNSEDFMTADWARLPQELLARIANRIVNEVGGVNRIVYDITSKPPATIEWE